MEIDFQKRIKEDGDKFKLLGVIGCKKCADKWKRALQKKHKHVRIKKSKTGWEVWATPALS